MPYFRGGGTKKKVGGLTLPLNDCTEAGVQGLHSEEFFSPLASEKVVGLSPPTPQSGGAKAPSAPPAPPPLPYFISIIDDCLKTIGNVKKEKKNYVVECSLGGLPTNHPLLGGFGGHSAVARYR